MTSPRDTLVSPTELAEYYSSLLDKHGDTALGAGWPDETARKTRFEVMAGIAGPDGFGTQRLCDVACGTGVFLEYLQEKGRAPENYLGIDICNDAISRAQAKFPEHTFRRSDLLAGVDPTLPEPADYTVINGLFTVRAGVDNSEMWAFMMEMLELVWPFTRKGLAFNVMSDVVDWRRDDLFHVPMDMLARYLFKLAGRRVIFRNDYDLYEYTAYVYKSPLENRGM